MHQADLVGGSLEIIIVDPGDAYIEIKLNYITYKTAKFVCTTTLYSLLYIQHLYVYSVHSEVFNENVFPTSYGNVT